MKRLLLLGAATGLLAACDSGGNTIATTKLNGLVLHPRDVGASFVRFDEGRQVRADLPAGARSDPGRFGRTDGWKARFRRSGSTSTRGPLVIESRADVFDSKGGADKDLNAFRGVFTGPSDVAAGRLLEAPRLGDDAFAATFGQGTGQFATRFYLVAWRDRNLSASVQVSGFEGKVSLADALALARKQQRRIAAA